MSSEEPSEGDEQAPKPVRRKRKKRPQPAAEPTAAHTVDAADDDAPETVDAREDLPAFARTFPRDPELDALVAAFEAGDYARVRREAPALAHRTESDAVRRAARELATRLDPDPLAKYLLAAAALLLAFLAFWYWTHPHEAP